MDVVFVRHNADVNYPSKAYSNDSGIDLYMPCGGIIEPGKIFKVKSGFSVDVPIGYEANLYPRSSVGSQGVITVMAPIDSSFAGEFSIILVNLSDTPFSFKANDRLCQMVFHSIAVVNPVVWADMSTRGNNGLGSSGV